MYFHEFDNNNEKMKKKVYEKLRRKVRLSTAITKVKDNKPAKDLEDHQRRVLSRESTPWVRYRFIPKLPVKTVQNLNPDEENENEVERQLTVRLVPK